MNIEKIIDEYEAPLGRYVKRIAKVSEADCEDILQEVFLKVYRHLNEYDESLKFSSWIYRIARNATIDWVRKKKSGPNVVNSEDAILILEKMTSDGDDLLVGLKKKMEAEEVREVLKQLDDKYEDVLVLRFLEDKDYSEVADIMQKPIGTIATLINRAKKQFKTKYDERHQK